MGLGREHVQEVLDPSRPEADVALRMDVAVDGFGRGKVGRGSVLGMGAMRYRVLMEEAIISPTTVALWL